MGLDQRSVKRAARGIRAPVRGASGGLSPGAETALPNRFLSSEDAGLEEQEDERAGDP